MLFKTNGQTDGQMDRQPASRKDVMTDDNTRRRRWRPRVKMQFLTAYYLIYINSQAICHRMPPKTASVAHLCSSLGEIITGAAKIAGFYDEADWRIYVPVN